MDAITEVSKFFIFLFANLLLKHILNELLNSNNKIVVGKHGICKEDTIWPCLSLLWELWDWDRTEDTCSVYCQALKWPIRFHLSREGLSESSRKPLDPLIEKFGSPQSRRMKGKNGLIICFNTLKVHLQIQSYVFKNTVYIFILNHL